MASVQFKKRGGANKAIRSKRDDSDEDETEVAKATVGVKAKEQFSSQSGSAASSSVTTVYESKREVVPLEYAGSATATLEINTEFERDVIAIKGKEKDPSKLNITTTKLSEGQYGPKRAPTFLRATSRFDYAPDICKDYKETGFCGYGDNCKFLHDRGDYKAGWQLEKEWDQQQREKKRKLAQLESAAAKKMAVATAVNNNNGDEEDEEAAAEALRAQLEESGNYEIGEGVEGEGEDGEQQLPFACHLCREPFTDPVVTLCRHYFCSQCAVDHARTSQRCAVCDKQTFGVFNKARQLLRRQQTRSSNQDDSNSNNFSGSGVVVSGVKLSRRQGNWETVTADEPTSV